MVNAKDFLNPNSMLTPGIAGGLTVTITLPLVTQFYLSFKWVALAVSFLIALSVIFSFKEKIKVPQKVAYCLLNTLIIFSVSVGAGVSMDTKPLPPSIPAELLEEPLVQDRDIHSSNTLSFWNLIGLSSAQANTNNTPPEAQQHDRVASESNYDPLKSDHRGTQIDNEKIRQDYKKQQQAYQKQVEEYKKRWSW